MTNTLSDQNGVLENHIRMLFDKKYKKYMYIYKYNALYLPFIYKHTISYSHNYIRKIMRDIIDGLDKIYPELLNTCSRILTPKIVGPTCWFMAALVAMFYSQRSRKLLLKASKSWENNKLFTLLKKVLNDHYLSSKGDKIEYSKFKDDTFGDILTELHVLNSKRFMFNRDKYNNGFLERLYIGRLYNLLNIDYTMFEYDTKDGKKVFEILGLKN